MALKTIGFSEVKARLSEVTEEVNRTGRPVLVYKHNRPRVTIAPAQQGAGAERQQSAFGILHNYADSSKWELEGSAWESEVLGRHAAS